MQHITLLKVVVVQNMTRQRFLKVFTYQLNQLQSEEKSQATYMIEVALRTRRLVILTENAGKRRQKEMFFLAFDVVSSLDIYVVFSGCCGTATLLCPMLLTMTSLFLPCRRCPFVPFLFSPALWIS